MANQVNMLVTTKNGNKTKINTITHVNPEAADSSLATFASSLFSLSENAIVGVSVAEKRSLDMPDPEPATPAKRAPVLRLYPDTLPTDDPDDDEVLNQYGFGSSDTNVITLPIDECSYTEGDARFNLCVFATNDIDWGDENLGDGEELQLRDNDLWAELLDEETGELTDGGDINNFVSFRVDGFITMSLTIDWSEHVETRDNGLGDSYFYRDDVATILIEKGFALTVETRETDEYLAGERTFIIKFQLPDELPADDTGE